MAVPKNEVWQAQTIGYYWLKSVDDRGNYRVVPYSQGKKLRLTTDARRRIQEEYDDPDVDPFRNGTFVRLDKSQQEDPETCSEQAYLDDDLIKLLDCDIDTFTRKVKGLNRLNMFRMQKLVNSRSVTTDQKTVVNDEFQSRYSRGGDTPLTRELLAER